MLRCPQLLLQLPEQGLGVLGVPVLQNAEPVALDVVQTLGRVIGVDDHAGDVRLHGLVRHIGDGVLHGTKSHRAIEHGGGQHQGHDAAGDLSAGFFLPAGQLDPAVQTAEHQKRPNCQQQLAGGQELGGYQPHHQHRATDHQHGEGDQAEPIRPAAAGGGGLFGCHSVSPLQWDKSPVRRFAKRTYYNSLLLYILRPQISIPNCNNFMNFPIFTSLLPGFIR